MVLILNSTWLSGPIMHSDWLKFHQNTVESGAKHHKPNHHDHSRVFNNQQNSNIKISVKQFVFNHVFSSEEKVLTYFPIRYFVKDLKRRPWQNKLIVRDNIINMVDTGILISFHNY
jgi:hypothetical protein